MKTKFAAIIGMILVLTSAAMPVQAAAAASGMEISRNGTVTEGVSYADRTDEFRYLKNGWHYRDGNWYYVRGGKAVTGWVKYIGKWYFLDKDGEMKTGWVKVSGKWYYLEASGEMKTGWVKVKGLWYYLASSGEMKTGWVTDGGRKYYLTSGGAMKTGWLKLGGKKYYLAPSGEMKTGWMKIGGKNCYFDANGVFDEEKSKEANAETAAESKKAENNDAKSVQQNTAAKTKGEMVAAYALQFVGNPYVYGGCSLTNGTDCSGFVMLVYRHFGVNLPHYDAAIRTKGKSVPSLKEAKAGDIICYYGHVAIYLGDGRIVHASNSRDGIKISERADYRTLAGIRRIFD